jgi:signal transduction histidine kinase
VKQRSLRSRLLTFLIIWGSVLFAFLVAAGAMHLTLFSRRWRLNWAFPLGAGSLFIAFGVLVVWRVLSPFRIMRERLSDVREGRSARLDGAYPSEVEPLVDDLNALLQDRDERVKRAVARAGDLAHGLKTPLAVLAHEIERADASGQTELAESMRQQVKRMRRQIETHLAHARVSAAAPTANARASVAAAAQALVRTMDRIYAERGLTIDVTVAPDVTVHAVLEDFEEMLGNLLDNSCKWAKSRVQVSAAHAADRILVIVDDDGPGIDADLREQVLQRGVRADEASSGSGLGLSIVRDLADAYGGSIALHPSPLGGLRATLSLSLGR